MFADLIVIMTLGIDDIRLCYLLSIIMNFLCRGSTCDKYYTNNKTYKKIQNTTSFNKIKSNYNSTI